jgi:cytidylate kinase
LTVPDGAVVVDTSDMEVGEVVDRVVGLAVESTG